MLSAVNVSYAAGPDQPDEVLVPRTVKDLVTGSGIVLVDRGMHALKGMQDTWQVFRVDKA